MMNYMAGRVLPLYKFHRPLPGKLQDVRPKIIGNALFLEGTVRSIRLTIGPIEHVTTTSGAEYDLESMSQEAFVPAIEQEGIEPERAPSPEPSPYKSGRLHVLAEAARLIAHVAGPPTGTLVSSADGMHSSGLELMIAQCSTSEAGEKAGHCKSITPKASEAGGSALKRKRKRSSLFDESQYDLTSKRKCSSLRERDNAPSDASTRSDDTETASDSPRDVVLGGMCSSVRGHDSAPPPLSKKVVTPAMMAPPPEGGALGGAGATVAVAADAASLTTPPKRKRGRPPGSKNKAKSYASMFATRRRTRKVDESNNAEREEEEERHKEPAEFVELCPKDAVRITSLNRHIYTNFYT